MPTILWVFAATTDSASHAGSLSGRSPPKTETQTAASPQDFSLSEGKGWKMGYDRRPHNPGSFSALLGGDDWSMALSRYEYDDFVKVTLYMCTITCQRLL